MRRSTKETLLLGGGVNIFENGSGVFKTWGVEVVCFKPLCFEGCEFWPEEHDCLRFLKSGLLFSAIVRLQFEPNRISFRVVGLEDMFKAIYIGQFIVVVMIFYIMHN